MRQTLIEQIMNNEISQEKEEVRFRQCFTYDATQGMLTLIIYLHEGVSWFKSVTH